MTQHLNQTIFDPIIDYDDFENQKSEEENVTKEPEMFEESNLEEDFEIPAFLRKQKN